MALTFDDLLKTGLNKFFLYFKHSTNILQMHSPDDTTASLNTLVKYELFLDNLWCPRYYYILTLGYSHQAIIRSKQNGKVTTAPSNICQRSELKQACLGRQ